MKEKLKHVLMQSPLYRVRNWLKKCRQEGELRTWEQNGRPVPPPHIVKQRVLLEYAGVYGLRVLIETGTYYGDMIDAMKCRFDRIYSIELSRDLCEKARKRFSGLGHIEIIHGDSGKEIKHILERIDRPALFWLDSHYSGGVTARGNEDTPIYQELDHILRAQDPGHVILIDDARCFGTDAAYPHVEQLRNWIHSRRSRLTMSVADDVIRIAPMR